MIPASVNPLTSTMVGNDAGWLLSFHNADDDEVVLEVGRDDYYAEIRASLPSGLEGGEYSFEIEGLTDEHYAAIARTRANPATAAYVDLYLYWRDTGSVSGYLTNLSGLTDTLGGLQSDELQDYLVAKLSVVSVKRKAGTRRYVTTITARERPFQLAKGNLVCGEVTSQPSIDVARQIAEDAGINVSPHQTELSAASDPNAEAAQFCAPERGRTTLDTLRYLAGRLEQGSNQHGRGMLLIRDGVLHIGARPTPLEGDPIALHEGAGLIEIESLAPVATDPNFDRCENDGQDPPTRKQFKLTLKGRPDIKPGSVVEFMPPAVDLSVSGGHWTGALGEMSIASFSGELLPSLGVGELGQGKVTMYVHSVEHKLGSTSSFVTTVTGVAIADTDSAWDEHSRLTRPDCCIEDQPQEASPSRRAARAHRALIRREMSTRVPTEIAEVRAMNVSGSGEPPAQTLTLWRGLVDSDGGSHQSRRLSIQRPSDAPIEGAPYTTPFAWGKTGLVLPRYPGTRVAVTHRHSQRGEPIDIGAMWESGQAPDSEPGDWWLILPVDVEQPSRQSVAEDEAPAGHSGQATNDLIDAEGNRVIEVGSFTLRFGKSELANAGTRPTVAESDAVTISHANGSSQIVMKGDGSIEIVGSNITLDAGSGEIRLKGSAVKVE